MIENVQFDENVALKFFFLKTAKQNYNPSARYSHQKKCHFIDFPSCKRFLKTYRGYFKPSWAFSFFDPYC